MRLVLIALLPIFLIGSAMGGEAERKARVQALVKQLADASPDTRQAAYAELRDTVVRKRDIPALTGEVARNANAEATKSLQELITFLQGTRWRLPVKGWTADADECVKSYSEEFKRLGCETWVGTSDEYPPKPKICLEILEEGVIGPEKKTGIIDLILTLEPEVLGLLWADWADITFIGSLANLEEITLDGTLVSDLTPLKGMSNLTNLRLRNTKIAPDLRPLNGLPNLRELDLKNSKVVTDLALLKDLPSLEWLVLEGTGVTDLTPLKGMGRLYHLDLENTKVTDLTSLKGLKELGYLYLRNTKVTDLTPLKGLENLYHLDLRDTKVTDLTPLKDMPNQRHFQLPDKGTHDQE